MSQQCRYLKLANIPLSDFIVASSEYSGGTQSFSFQLIWDSLSMKCATCASWDWFMHSARPRRCCWSNVTFSWRFRRTKTATSTRLKSKRSVGSCRLILFSSQRSFINTSRRLSRTSTQCPQSCHSSASAGHLLALVKMVKLFRNAISFPLH